MEANSSLMKRFDESRQELEKVLKMAQSCLTERGNPEELLKKHTVRKHDLCKIHPSIRSCTYSVSYVYLNAKVSPGTAWNNATEKMINECDS